MTDPQPGEDPASFDPSKDPDIAAADIAAARLGCSPDHIPEGPYCYSRVPAGPRGASRIARCPYWTKVRALPEQLDGYCAYLREGDWGEGLSHLFDQLKECGENENADEDLEPDMAIEAAAPSEVDTATIYALHRGFRELHRYTGGTEFTSWENPLPNLTWSRQPIAKVKSWLEEGGFPWEVREALKRKAKGKSIEEEDE
ncbi:hypothetical protein [Defluviimonas salinarum]|nr:hypothetical protein [Defluviimonas salinarum]